MEAEVEALLQSGGGLQAAFAFTSSGAALHFRPPPADSDKEEAPVAEEFGWLALEGVSYELERPANDEESCRKLPCAVVDGCGEQREQRQEDERNAERVAEAVYRMLMTAGVLGDPLLAGAVS